MNKFLAVIMRNGNLSIGRLLLLTCFIIACIKWCHGQDIQQGQVTILLTLIGYLFGGKVIEGITSIKQEKNQ